MSHCPDPKAIRIRMTKLPPLPRGPRLSQTPWAGFTRHDCPRGLDLPACPSRRCGRAKACVAAHDGLYCRRTHFSPAEQQKWEHRDPHLRALAALPDDVRPGDLPGQAKRLVEIYSIRLQRQMAMTERWQAGEFDHLYGPWRARGALLKPPPKIYVEGPAGGRAKGAGQGRAGAL